MCCENQISSDLFERVKARVDIMENARAGKKFSSTESDIDAADFERLLIFGEAALQAVASETYTPKNHKDAMKCEEGELWYDSEYEEFAQMLDMNCFKLITKSEMKHVSLRARAGTQIFSQPPRLCSQRENGHDPVCSRRLLVHAESP